MATPQALGSGEESQPTPTPDQWAIVVHVTLADIGVQMMWEEVEVEVIDSTSSQVMRVPVIRGPWAGTFYIGPHAMATDPPPPGQKFHRVSVRISAPGYASFTYLNIPLFPGDTAILTPILSLVEQVDDISVRAPERVPGGLPGTGTGEGGGSRTPVVAGALAASTILLLAGAAVLMRKRAEGIHP